MNKAQALLSICESLGGLKKLGLDPDNNDDWGNI